MPAYTVSKTKACQITRMHNWVQNTYNTKYTEDNIQDTQNNKTHKWYTEQMYSYRTVTVYDIRKKGSLTSASSVWTHI